MHRSDFERSRCACPDAEGSRDRTRPATRRAHPAFYWLRMFLRAASQIATTAGFLILRSTEIA
jgi:hypothetical protein